MQADETVKKILEDEQTIRKELSKLSGDTLTIMSRNHEIARNYARNALEKIGAVEITEEHIESVANGMQMLAKAILGEKARK